MIFYIHGLNSSANSEKLKKLQAFFTDETVVGLEYDSKALDDYEKVFNHLKAQIDQFNHYNQILLIGTSLGGYWSNQLSNFYKCKKVLLNPCLFPSKMMAYKINQQQTIYETGETYIFTQKILDALSKNENALYKDKTLVFLEMGDEVLDNRLNQGILEHTTSFEGGNHRFQRFEAILPEVSKLYYAEI
jgi:uncharacterized protein